MGKILVLAEKPSVGKELARVLGCRGRKDGYIEGASYIVTWALGHLVTLADPEHYDSKYKKWALETLPMIPKKMDLEVIKQTSKQYKTVKSLMKSTDVERIVIATDAGREGELVARWIIKKAGIKKPMLRLWISSQTDNAIKEGFLKLRPAEEYDNLYKAAVCRAEADWLVGLNVTRALTCKHNAQLSAGRVQSPTLYMIIQRENEIKEFKPKEYYTIKADAGKFIATWRDKKSNNARTFDKAKADDIINKVSGKPLKILEVKKKLKKDSPPLLYDLTELQRDANKKFGFSAKQTLNIMQRLYENHKLLTYPRTDSRYLTEDILPTLPERLKSISVGGYAAYAKAILKSSITPTKRLVDNSKVSDHHAIIPTEQFVDLSALTADEKRVYDLVVKRFLATLSPDFEYEHTTIKADIAGELFTASGKVVKSNGWKAVYDSSYLTDEDELNDNEDKDQLLPTVKEGDTFKANNIFMNISKTKPPARYTEATLLSAMEHAGKFIEDKNMRSVIEGANGIGTPATRADIIEKLFTTGYIERRGKEIFPLSKGIQLIDIIPDDLKSPKLTAEWEEKLNLISKGMSKSLIFTKEIRGYAEKLVRDVISSAATYRHDNITMNRCPNCNEFMLEVNGKKGKMLVCMDRECGYRKNLSILSNARCPNCHKKLEIFGEGERKNYICSCGFKEKFDIFNKRLEENRNNLSKREVERYLKKQNEDNGPSAFELAWKKAMANKEK